MTRGNYDHFSWIYDVKSGWGGKGSGRGSNADFNKRYVSFINDYLKQNSIERVLDIGCGDWQFSQFIDWGDVYYIGIDVVKSVIENNKSKFYRQNGNINFLNAQVHDLNDLDFDLVLNKDCFPHLPFSEITSILAKVDHIPHKLFTVDTHNNTINSDAPIGGYRTLRLDIDPFNLKGTYVGLFENSVKKTFMIN